MVSRTTDDYARMTMAGRAAVSEPAFWAGFDRGSTALLPRDVLAEGNPHFV